MTDNIRPDHYRTGEIDLYESWYRTYPFNEYRAIMQAVAERYMRRDKNDRVEDLDKAMETLKRLKEKEIEHDSKYGERTSKGETGILKADTIHVFDERISLLRNLYHDGFEYLARYENGELWAHSHHPTKKSNRWSSFRFIKNIYNDDFPEIQWTDNEPTKIAELLASYENSGENGKVEVE